MEAEEPSKPRPGGACKPPWAGPHLRRCHWSTLPRDVCEEYDAVVMCIELEEPFNGDAAIELFSLAAKRLYRRKFGGWDQATYQKWLILAILRWIDEMAEEAAPEEEVEDEQEALPFDKAA